MSELNSPQQAQDPDALYHLCYVSAETVSFSQDELVLLLDRALVKALGHDVNKGMGVE